MLRSSVENRRKGVLTQMSILVDASVRSLAMRRDVPESVPEVEMLLNGIDSGTLLYGTGIIVKKLLQGFTKPKAHDSILERFAAIPLMVPENHHPSRSIRSMIAQHVSRAVAESVLADARLISADQVCLVSFLDYDLGFFDKNENRVEPAQNPFTPEKVLTMSPE